MSSKQRRRVSIRNFWQRKKNPPQPSSAGIENQSDNASSSSNQSFQENQESLLTCPVCYIPKSPTEFPVLSCCEHRTCATCLKRYVSIQILESRTNITCPECSEYFYPNEIKSILDDDEIWLKYEEFSLRRILVSDPDCRWCPAPDCGYAVIAAGCASCPRLHCERPRCNTDFCYHCKQYWHPNQTCDAARLSRSRTHSNGGLASDASTAQALQLVQELGSEQIKMCPRCAALIIKVDDGSCNHMVCSVCSTEFCWLCMREITDLHYLSPSGCTFWGKKPWSRKKKILWQLGTIIGAPIGIGLIATISVPAIIIGVPVYIGRKIDARFTNRNRQHKRHAAITAGVSASIVVSPILAAVAVGIGVPILLAYVYGVVPVSLCRSGSCTDDSAITETYERDTRTAVEALFSKTLDSNSKQGTSDSKNAAEGLPSQIQKFRNLHLDSSDTASTSNIIATVDAAKTRNSTSIQLHGGTTRSSYMGEDDFNIYRSASDSRALARDTKGEHCISSRSPLFSVASRNKNERSRSCSGRDTDFTVERRNDMTLSPVVSEVKRFDSASALSERTYSVGSATSSVIVTQPNVPISADSLYDV